jgi:hypothetical protein
LEVGKGVSLEASPGVLNAYRKRTDGVLVSGVSKTKPNLPDAVVYRNNIKVVGFPGMY